MKARMTAALCAALFVSIASAVSAQPAASPEPLSEMSTPKQFDLNKVTCGDFLNLSLTDRGYLLSMYFGFAAAKSGTTEFVTADLRTRAQKVADFCATSPKTMMLTAVENSSR